MTKPVSNQKVRSFFKVVKPWLVILVFVLILRFTGALSGISIAAHSVILESGLMNFDPKENLIPAKNFDYDFQLKDLKGDVVDFNQFKGKVLFINLWATWCGPCRAEMPSIQNLYNSVDHDKIAFIMLSLDNPENQQKVIKYIADKKFDFPVYVPSNGLPEQLSVPSIPTTLIVTKDGKIKTKNVGTANYDTDKFRKFLQELSEAVEVKGKK